MKQYNRGRGGRSWPAMARRVRTPRAGAPMIALLTDFGTRDAYVGVMKGVIAGIAPGVPVIDLCHDIPAQDVRAGAFQLLISHRYFPPRTIFVAVIDPGVGTSRPIIAATAGKWTFIGPDNGLLRWTIDEVGGFASAVAVEAPQVRGSEVSATFHGRDIMAPAAAHLASGRPLQSLGPPVQRLSGEPFPPVVWLGGRLAGCVLYVDHFGNCITNIRHEHVASATTVEVGGTVVPRARTYGDVPAGTAIALIGSSGFLEIAVAGGSAQATLNLEVGARVTLSSPNDPHALPRRTRSTP